MQRPGCTNEQFQDVTPRVGQIPLLQQHYSLLIYTVIYPYAFYYRAPYILYPISYILYIYIYIYIYYVRIVTPQLNIAHNYLLRLFKRRPILAPLSADSMDIVYPALIYCRRCTFIAVLRLPNSLTFSLCVYKNSYTLLR